MGYPEKIGECVDLFYELRSKRIELERQAAKLKEEQDDLENYIFDTFDKSGLEGCKGKLATAAITRSQVPRLTDGVAFAQHIRDTMDLDLLSLRPKYEACRERWENGETIPGVEAYQKIGLSVTKR